MAGRIPVLETRSWLADPTTIIRRFPLSRSEDDDDDDEYIAMVFDQPIREFVAVVIVVGGDGCGI